MGGFVDRCAPRCPAFLTFRDSPALVRQESGGYPVRPACYDPLADRPSPLPFSNLDEPMTVASALAAARPRAPPPPHTHTHTAAARAPRSGTPAQRFFCSRTVR